MTLRGWHHAAKLQIRCMAVSWKSLTVDCNQNPMQLTNLTACLDLIQTVFDNFFEIKTSDVIGIPFAIFTQLRLCLGLLYHLSTMECPGWDTGEVRRQIDILAIIDKTIDRFQAASRESDAYGEDSLRRITGHLQVMRSTWAVRIQQTDSQRATFTMTPDSVAEIGVAELPLLDDFLDMDWLMSSL